jgi:hypothetical protein
MLEAILKRLKSNKRGISNVIVVMLSLVLIVIVVGNVVLWSYQMNRLDLERMQETVNIANVTRVTRSSWFTAQKEFSIIAGSKLSGTYGDTKFSDGSFETFREETTQLFNPSSYVLGGFTSYVSGSLANLNSNDDSYMNFRSYPNYEIRYQESLDVSSTTNTTYQDKVSISFTPQITADFIIIATAEVRGSSTSYQAKSQLSVNSTTFQELFYRVKDLTDWYPFCGLKRLTLNEGTKYVAKIQFCTNNAAGTASIRNARLLIFSLQSEYAESEGLSTTDSTEWQDKTTLTFTPPSNEDYLIIATANYRGSSTSRDTKIRLIQDNTTVHTENLGRPGAGTTANYYTFAVMRKVTLDATLHNFKIQYCSSGSPGIAGINYAHIVAVKLSLFDSNYYAEDEVESIPAASNTWYDKVVNNYTVDDGDYLIMGSISYKSGSTANSVGLDFQTESTSRQSPLVEHRDSTTYESAFFMTKQSLTAGSKTDKIAWMGESTNARVKNARLISCKLPTLIQTVEVEFTGISNTQNWTQLEWTIDSSFTTTNVATTFQLYNYQTNQYPTSGDGYMNDTVSTVDVTKNQTITETPTNFRDADGNWKIKIKGVKAADTQLELRADWIEFKVMTSDIYRLCISNDFLIDLSTYPLNYIQGVEILVRYNVTQNVEKWFLKAYHWTASSFSDVGFNNTVGNQPVLNEWNEYAINVTDEWKDYVKDDGTLLLEFLDEGLNTTQTIAEIDFLGVRAIIDGTRFDLRNTSPLTIHITAVWMVNSTNHQRYSANLFINSGEETTYIRVDINLPGDDFIAKVVTERGNIAVFTGD